MYVHIIINSRSNISGNMKYYKQYFIIYDLYNYENNRN